MSKLTEIELAEMEECLNTGIRILGTADGKRLIAELRAERAGASQMREALQHARDGLEAWQKDQWEYHPESVDGWLTIKRVDDALATDAGRPGLEELRALREENRRLLDLLNMEGVGWEIIERRRYCTQCDQPENKGHSPDCPIGAALERNRALVEGVQDA